MSTASISPGLYALPRPERRLSTVLRHLRRAARRTVEWLVRQARGAMFALRDTPALTGIATRLRALPDLVRSVGPAPAAAALLGIPVVRRTATRLVRLLVTRVASTTRASWHRTRSLLLALGPAGVRTTARLDGLVDALGDRLATITTHSLSRNVARGIASLATVVSAASQATVIHRLLVQLVGPSWLRSTVELFLIPLTLLPGVVGYVINGLRRTAPSMPGPDREQPGTSDPEGDRPTPNATAAADLTNPAPDAGDDTDGKSEPSNRAGRRAQQQAQARARRGPKR